MSNTKKIVTIATTLLFCLTTQSALAQSQHRDHQRSNDRSAMKALNLSDSQKEAIKAIHQQAKQSQTWDAVTASSLVESKLINRQAHKLANAQNRQAVFAVLTAEQQQTLIAGQAAKFADRDPLKRPQKRLEKLLRMAKKVEATEAQLAQLTAIHADASASMQAQHTTVMAHKMAERALIQASEFDTDAWLSVQDEFAPTAIEVGVLGAKTRFDIKQVFTAEQQQKLRKMKQRMNKKGNKGQKEERKERS